MRRNSRRGPLFCATRRRYRGCERQGKSERLRAPHATEREHPRRGRYPGGINREGPLRRAARASAPAYPSPAGPRAIIRIRAIPRRMARISARERDSATSLPRLPCRVAASASSPSLGASGGSAACRAPSRRRDAIRLAAGETTSTDVARTTHSYGGKVTSPARLQRAPCDLCCVHQRFPERRDTFPLAARWGGGR